MRALIQRVLEASVTVNGETVGKIGAGLLVFLGVTHEDNVDIMQKMVDKVTLLRIFEDENEKLNLSLKDVQGEILVVSQFTLYGDCSKGRRPSFVQAAQPSRAKTLYTLFMQELKSRGFTVESGEFGAKMEVSLLNDGPTTFSIDI